MKIISMMRKPEAFEVVCPTDWQDKPVPPRRWLIPGLLIRGSVTMLNGDGGVGKSLLAQQLVTAMATGRSFLGIEAQRPVPALAMFCEDDIEELHFRQSRINAHFGCAMRELGGLSLISRVGLNNELMVFDRRTDMGEETSLYHQLAHKIRQDKVELIVVDTAADTFMGSEIIRPQVLQFINALRRLAAINDGGVLLTAHPSLTGINSGSGLSGSTAWNNTVRGRLYLTRPPGSDADDENEDGRVLKLMKSNYGPSGGKIRLRWLDHAFVLEGQPSGAGAGKDLGMVERIAIEVAVLGGLRQLVGDGVLVPADAHARNGLAVRLRSFAACKRWNWQSIIAAQERLIASGKIVKVELGRASKRRAYVRPHDMRLPGEVDVAKAGE